MNERYARQAAIVPSAAIASADATVIGVGAIGRQVALQLSAIGVPKLHLIDFDRVEEVNLPTQGYRESDLGKYKAKVTAAVCKQIAPSINVSFDLVRFTDESEVGNAVFMCVDHMDTRRLIFQTVSPIANFICDGRMAAEVCRVVTAYDEESKLYYPDTLFSDENAYEGSCTARSTIFCANIAAGFMVGQFTKFLRGMKFDRDVLCNILAMEMEVK